MEAREPREPVSAGRGIRELSCAEAAVRWGARRVSRYREWALEAHSPEDGDVEGQDAGVALSDWRIART